MSRYIDADALIAWIKGSQQMTSKMKCVIAKIETMPDAVSVVRCKECKHWWECKPRDGGDCDHYEMNTKPDDYCSYGERKGE